MPLHPILEIHGSYPHDFGRHSVVRDLTREEAGKLLGLDPVPPGSDDLFLNKGFIVLGLPLPRDYSVDLRTQLSGKQAVYLSDGWYRLIAWP